MSLIFRMLYIYILSFFKEKLPIGVSTNKLNLVTLPNDLDLNFYVNNGRFLTLCDLNHIDFFIRTGLLKLMLKEKWRPVIIEYTMKYRKSLKVFKKFTVSMTLEYWDEKYFYMTHEFKKNGIIIAEGTSKAAIRNHNGVVVPEAVCHRPSNMKDIFLSSATIGCSPNLFRSYVGDWHIAWQWAQNSHSF